MESLANALHVSRSLLKIRFHTVREEGVAAAIRRRKLEEVCRLLRETDLPIDEIAALIRLICPPGFWYNTWQKEVGKYGNKV